MKTLSFEGHSDDTFGEYGVTNDDYDCCASDKAIVFEVTVPLPDEEVGLFVIGQYNSDDWFPDQPACWMIGLQQFQEDAKLPPWPMRWGISERGYSPVLEIDVPDAVRVRCLNAAKCSDDD